jgi:hypothetical protein
VLDLVMRLGWAILISPTQTYLQQHLVLLLGCVELVRRSMWAVFRVEWEWIKIQRKHAAEEEGDSSKPSNVSSAVSQQEVMEALTFCAAEDSEGSAAAPKAVREPSGVLID